MKVNVVPLRIELSGTSRVGSCWHRSSGNLPPCAVIRAAVRSGCSSVSRASRCLALRSI